MTPQEIEDKLNADPRYQALDGPERVAKRKAVYDRLGVQPPTFIAKPGTLENDPDGPAHKYARPVLEALGMAGGAVLGTPLGPYGTAGGGILGYAGGDAAASYLERLVGERPPIKSLSQAAKETLGGVKTGAYMEAGGQLAGKIIPKILAPFSEGYQGQNKLVDELAKERGIQLDPHEVMQSRPMALGHKVLENVPFTSGMIQRAELEKLSALTKEWQKLRDSTGAPQRQRIGEIGSKIQDTIEKQLDKAGVRQGEVRDQMREDIMQRMGSPVSYKELGGQTQKAITQLHEAKKGIEALAWDHAREGIPEGARAMNDNLKAYALQTRKEYEDLPSFLDEPIIKQLGDMARSGNPEYDKLVATIPDGLPKAVRDKLVAEVTKDQQPGWKVQSLLKLRSAISDKAAEHHSGIQRGDASKGSADIYGKIYTGAIKAIDKDLEAYGAKAGSDIAERFSAARKLSGERMSLLNQKENPAVVKAITSEAETLHRMLIRPGNAAGYTQLKETVGEHSVRPLKQAFTNQLLGIGGKEAESLYGLRSTLDRYGRQTLAEVYSEPELKNLYNLADKSQWMKQSPVGNPFFREMVKSNPSQVAPAILSDANTTSKVLRQFPQMKQHLRQAFIDGVHPNDRTPFPTRLMEVLKAYPKDVQRQLFTHNEMVDFYQLAKIIERTKGTVKLAENPSGTAQNIISAHQLGMVIQNPLKASPEVLTSTALAKLYLSKTGRKLLMEGLVTPYTASKGTELGVKIGAILGNDAIGRQQEKSDKPAKRTPITFDDEE